MTTLRPTCFDDYIGQPAVIDMLRAAVTATKRGGWTLDHFLFAGPPGLGKTSLAAVIAAELGVRLRTTSGPAIEHRGQLASMLASLESGDVLFIDEIHRVPVATLEILYTAMEDRRVDLFAGKKPITCELAPFTLLAATTNPGSLPAPLLDRFGHVFTLVPYDTEDLTTIVTRGATRLGLEIAPDAATVIARRSRGTPRIAFRLLRRARDLATGPMLDVATTLLALERLGIDALGLSAQERAYMDACGDGAIGIEALVSATGTERATIEEQIEPTLVQMGLVKRTHRGRVLTQAGRAHLTKTTTTLTLAA